MKKVCDSSVGSKFNDRKIPGAGMGFTGWELLVFIHKFQKSWWIELKFAKLASVCAGVSKVGALLSLVPQTKLRRV